MEMQRRNEIADSSLEENDLMIPSNQSPPPAVNLHPRRLRFDPDFDAAGDNGEGGGGNAAKFRNNNSQKERNNNNKDVSVSPPYRKVRNLRLFDTPATPKTILQKSSGRLSNHLSTAVSADLLKRRSEVLTKVDKPKALPLLNRTLDTVVNRDAANVNPFTPDSLLAQNKKRARTQVGRENRGTHQSLRLFLNSEEEKPEFNEIVTLPDWYQAPKRLALQDTNISRYEKEFVEISLIGTGEFGKVFQCLNRLDGCIYAIKKSIRPVAGSSFEKRALNEVWAHAVLGKHDNVVRYYSAWAEDNHMLIQNEFCNGGSLQSLLQKHNLAESELKILLLHVAEGLRYIHSLGLVHMDLKPGNIFLTKTPTAYNNSLPPLTPECIETGMEGIYEELNGTDFITTYKIGDLGHVTSVKEPNVEEGDCRYLPNEILQEDFSHLFAADIFSLGLTLYEAAGGGPLPKNGPEWHNLRNGNIPSIPSLSKEFNDLIRSMAHPDPKERPLTAAIFSHPVLRSMESKGSEQLTQELMIEKRKNEILLSKLREAKNALKAYEQNYQAGKFGLNVHPHSDQRCLRSYTRKLCSNSTCRASVHASIKKDGLRDRNKNLIKTMKY